VTSGTDPQPGIQAANIGDFRGLGFYSSGALLVAAPGQAGKAFLAHQHREGVDADAVAGGSQFRLDVVNRQIALTYRHGQFANTVASGSRAGTARRRREKGGALLRVVSELIGEHAKAAGRIAEAPGGPGRRDLFGEEGARGLVLALEGQLGGEEKSGGIGLCYATTSTAIHVDTMLLKQLAFQRPARVSIRPV
jgi:hypothetical protein